MYDILVRAVSFICVIALGYVLKRIGFMRQEEFKTISKIVIKLTLTATIVVNFSGKTLDTSMFLMTAFGLGFGILMMVIGFIAAFRKSREDKAFAMINSSGCNIGNFALPFAQNFFGPISIIAISLFDLGNSIITLGGSVSTAKAYLNSDEKFSVVPMLKTLVKSVPLVTYIIMTILSLMHLSIPAPVISYAQIIANANAFLAMFMIGVGFNISGDGSQIKDIVRIVGIRYIVGIALAVVTYLFLPLPMEWKQPLVILFLSPVPSAAPAYTDEINGDYGLASAINSFSMIISIVLITASLVIMLG